MPGARTRRASDPMFTLTGEGGPLASPRNGARMSNLATPPQSGPLPSQSRQARALKSVASFGCSLRECRPPIVRRLIRQPVPRSEPGTRPGGCPTELGSGRDWGSRAEFSRAPAPGSRAWRWLRLLAARIGSAFRRPPRGGARGYVEMHGPSAIVRLHEEAAHQAELLLQSTKNAARRLWR